MSWHPFKSGEAYKVDYIVSTLTKHLDSGQVQDVGDKSRLVGLLEPYHGQQSFFHPFSSGWGASPYNLSVWRTADGAKLVSNYKPKRTRRTFSAKTREQVVAKTGGYCYSCGEKFSDSSEVWIEHIIPFSIGGSDELENLLPGCKICNWTRRNYSPHQIRRILSVGAVLIRQIDRETELGRNLYVFLESEDVRRTTARKTKGAGYLIYKRLEKSE
jgi:hypothetical protein